MSAPVHSLLVSGQRFAAVTGTPTPPAGQYVMHRGAYYPVNDRVGYPLSVLADVAAEHSNQLVIIPTESGVVAMVSGTTRIVSIDRETADSESFYRALLRTMLGCETRQVISIGPIPDFPYELKVKALSDLSLPPVIHKRRSLQMIGLIAAAAVLGLVFGGIASSRAASRVEAVKSKTAEANQEMATLTSTVMDGRRRLANAPKEGSLPTAAPMGNQSMPQQTSSYLDAFYRLSSVPPALAISVKGGEIEFASHAAR